MSDTQAKQTYYVLEYPTGAKCVLDGPGLIETLGIEMDNAELCEDDGVEFKIEIRRMTPAEVDALPEFEGP